MKQRDDDLPSPFRFDGPLPPGELIGRERELEQLLAAARDGRLTSVFAPRRYGKTSLLASAVHVLYHTQQMATVLVDLLGVVSLTDLAVRLERAYARHLRGAIRRRVEALFAADGLGLSLSGGGFGVMVSRAPRTDPLPALHALLDLPTRLPERAFVVFDEFQSVMGIQGAEAIIRSHVQHHPPQATYAFAGSEPGLMQRAFADRGRPLYAQAEPLRLGRLPDPPVLAHLHGEFERTGRGLGEMATPLLRTAAGHPQRTMLLAHLLWTETEQGETADPQGWQRALAHALASTRYESEARWAALRANERRVVRAVVEYGSPLAADALAALGLAKGSVQSTVQRLVADGDIERADDRSLRIVDPLFASWVGAHAPGGRRR